MSKQGRRRCVFCGGTPVSREHVLPRWAWREVHGEDYDGRPLDPENLMPHAINVPTRHTDGSLSLERVRTYPSGLLLRRQAWWSSPHAGHVTTGGCQSSKARSSRSFCGC